VRRGEGFVQVQLDDVKAQIAGPRFAQIRVGVRPVAVKQAAPAVDDGCHFFDVAFKQAQRVGVGEHQRGDVFGHQGFQMRKVNAAFRVGAQRDRLEPAQRAGGGIGSMRRVGNQDLTALFSPFLEIFFDHHHAGQFAVRAGRRLQREIRHAEKRAQQCLHVVHQLQASLGECLRRERVQVGKAGQGSDIFVDFGIVFHRAGTQRIKTEIDAEVPPR